jgi:protein ImuB
MGAPSPAERGERTLVVWCPDWPVVAAGASLDEPVAVVHANRVVACSPAARHEGVTQGLRRRESQSRCPDLLVLDHDPGRDARAFEPVVAALDALTPRVAVERAGTVAFATRGPARYFGGDDALAGRTAALVATALEGRGSVQVGVADGAFPAACAARRAAPGQPAVVVGAGDSRAFVAPLPVETLTLVGDELLDEAGERRTVDALVDVLGRLGLRTLGALADLAATDVLARFGPVGALAHRLARGLDSRPLSARRPAPELAVDAELDPPVEQVAGAVFVAKMLADRLHESLGRQGLACIQVLVTAETEHAEVHQRRWRHEGSLTAAAVAERVRWQLDGWLSGSVATRPTAGITRITLTPDEVVAAQGRQLGFWGGETKVDERVVRALARVAGMLGDEAVTVPERRGGRGPAERVGTVAVAAVDLGAERPAARPDWVAEPWPGHLPPPSPALVVPELQPAEVLDRRGEPVRVTGRGTITAAPAGVSLPGSGRGQARRGVAPVVSWAGPWPAEERWWDATGHRRRARIQVVVADGDAHLLVLENGRWWLEGTYD